MDEMFVPPRLSSHLQHALTSHMWQHLCVRALPCPTGSLAGGQNKLLHKKETSLLNGFIDCLHSLPPRSVSLSLSLYLSSP